MLGLASATRRNRSLEEFQKTHSTCESDLADTLKLPFSARLISATSPCLKKVSSEHFWQHILAEPDAPLSTHLWPNCCCKVWNLLCTIILTSLTASFSYSWHLVETCSLELRLGFLGGTFFCSSRFNSGEPFMVLVRRGEGEDICTRTNDIKAVNYSVWSKPVYFLFSPLLSPTNKCCKYAVIRFYVQK